MLLQILLQINILHVEAVTSLYITNFVSDFVMFSPRTDSALSPKINIVIDSSKNILYYVIHTYRTTKIIFYFSQFISICGYSAV